jgi:hypothetical protein
MNSRGDRFAKRGLPLSLRAGLPAQGLTPFCDDPAPGKRTPHHPSLFSSSHEGAEELSARDIVTPVSRPQHSFWSSAGLCQQEPVADKETESLFADLIQGYVQDPYVFWLCPGLVTFPGVHYVDLVPG